MNQIHNSEMDSNREYTPNNLTLQASDETKPFKIYMKEIIQFPTRQNFFINRSCIDGIRFLDGRFGLLDRIFWACVLTVSFIGMVVIFVYTANTYANEAISINVDLAYLNWNSIFPAISFCMLRSHTPFAQDRIKKFVQNYYAQHNITEPDDFYFYDHLITYLFLSASDTFYSELDACHAINSTCGVDIDTLKRLIIPHDCSGIFSDIQFNDRRYDSCGEIFKLQNTEMGTCFTANGVYFYNFDVKQLPLTYDRSDLQRKFTFEFMPDNLYTPYIFIHSPEDFPNFNSRLMFDPISYNAKFEYLIQTIETENSLNIRDEPITKRQCRFPDERWPDDATLPYSFASCLTYVRVQFELKLCNCTIHTSPIEYKDRYCNYNQSYCVKAHETTKKTLHHHHFIEPCLPSCTEMEINLVGKYTELKPNPESDEELKHIGFFPGMQDESTKKSTVVIEIENIQTFRLIRNVSFNRLDFVVTIGGIVGLFFGASILSLIEMIYIWFLRKC